MEIFAVDLPFRLTGDLKKVMPQGRAPLLKFLKDWRGV